MKNRRRLLVIGGVFVALLLLILVVLPAVLRGPVRTRVDRELATRVKGQVYYGDLSLSMLRHFPHLTVSLRDFGVVGEGTFEGDTLADIERLTVSLNLWSVLGGDRIEVGRLELDRPRIEAVRLSDGQANWDIMRADTTAPDEPDTAAPSGFALRVDRWAITRGEVIFLDRISKTFLEIHGLEHSGSGDITSTVYDLDTRTDMARLTLEMDSVKYLDDRRLGLRLVARVDQGEGLYTIRESQFTINDLGIAIVGRARALPQIPLPPKPATRTAVDTGRGAAGQVGLARVDTAPAMQTPYDLDLTFESVGGDFKRLLSLIPGLYRKDYDGLKAEGTFSLKGLVKGRYQEGHLPRMRLESQVRGGQMQYPSLPSAITGVNMDLLVDHPEGRTDQLALNLKRFELKVGRNPVEARLQSRGLEDIQLEGQVRARLDLGELSRAYPVGDGLELRGLLNLDAQAKGVYSQARKRIPALTLEANLLDGFVRSPDLPAPLEGLSAQLSAQNGTGRMEDTRMRIPSLAFTMDGQPFRASGTVDDLVNYRWDIAATGRLDLGKLTRMFPIEGTTVAGRMDLDLKTRGAMADVEAGRYDRLPTSGTVIVEGLEYRSKDLPQGIKASEMRVRLSPEAIALEKFEGSAGRSPLSMDGVISQYWPYILKDGTLRGRLKVSSTQFDVNEWIAADPAPTPTAADTAHKAPEIPRNLDLALDARADRVLYDNLTLENFQGRVVVKDGIVRLEGVRAQALEGQLDITGSYDARQPARPSYQMNIRANQIAIPAAFKAFSTLRALAPVAGQMQGRVSTQLNLSGLLDDKMSPLLPTLDGGGQVSLRGASVQSLSLVQGLNRVGGVNLPSQAQLRDLLVRLRIINGRVNFEPFDLDLGGQKLTLGGANGFDQSIDWNVTAMLPAQAATALAGASSNLLGQLAPTTPVDVQFRVTGTQQNPQVALAGVGRGALANAQTAALDRARDEANRIRQEAEDRTRQEADRVRREAEERGRQEADRARGQVEDRAKGELNKLRDRVRLPR